jgi:hypothetical protein
MRDLRLLEVRLTSHAGDVTWLDKSIEAASSNQRSAQALKNRQGESIASAENGMAGAGGGSSAETTGFIRAIAVNVSVTGATICATACPPADRYAAYTG